MQLAHQKTPDASVRWNVRKLMSQGVYHQDELFGRLYPTYVGHYSRLRELIAEEKANA